MEPLSLKARRIYSTIFFVLFVIILPVVGLYASGYRLQGVEIVATGGIFIATPLSGFFISINGEEVDRSTLFSKTFFFDNLEEGSYVVQVSAEGYHPWSKTLVVEPRVVTDVSAISVVQPLSILKLATSTDALDDETASSTTRLVSETFYDSVVNIFSATSTSATTTVSNGNVVSTSTSSTTPLDTLAVPEDTVNGVALLIEEGNLRATYIRSSNPPSSFCTRPSSCVQSFMLERGVETVTEAQFFAGGALYQTKESGVYFTEVEVRQPRFSLPIFTAPEARFSVINGTLIVESNGSFFEVSGF